VAFVAMRAQQFAEKRLGRLTKRHGLNRATGELHGVFNRF
jgi:hypothetical protein